MAFEKPRIPTGIEIGEITDDEQTIGVLTFMTSEGSFRFYIDNKAAEALGMALELIRRKSSNGPVQ